MFAFRKSIGGQTSNWNLGPSSGSEISQRNCTGACQEDHDGTPTRERIAENGARNQAFALRAAILSQMAIFHQRRRYRDSVPLIMRNDHGTCSRSRLASIVACADSNGVKTPIQISAQA